MVDRVFIILSAFVWSRTHLQDRPKQQAGQGLPERWCATRLQPSKRLANWKSDRFDLMYHLSKARRSRCNSQQNRCCKRNSPAPATGDSPLRNPTTDPRSSSPIRPCAAWRNACTSANWKKLRRQWREADAGIHHGINLPAISCDHLALKPAFLLRAAVSARATT